MKATKAGRLLPIPDCYIIIPIQGAPATITPGKPDGMIELTVLPDITDGKSANYSSEDIIGRTAPLYTYSHSGDRSIGMQLHFYITEPGDAVRNLGYLRLIESAVYPREGESGAPYRPPVICKLRCGDLLSTKAEDDQGVCAILTSYSVKFPTEVAWENDPAPPPGFVGPVQTLSDQGGQYCPYKFDVDTSWIVVYTNPELPFADRIVQTGYK